MTFALSSGETKRNQWSLLQPQKDLNRQRVGTDLFQWENKQYVLVVDYFLRYIEIALLKETSSDAVINHLKSIFARHGIPEVVISDNGPHNARPHHSQKSTDLNTSQAALAFHKGSKQWGSRKSCTNNQRTTEQSQRSVPCIACIPLNTSSDWLNSSSAIDGATTPYNSAIAPVTTRPRMARYRTVSCSGQAIQGTTEQQLQQAPS